MTTDAKISSTNGNILVVDDDLSSLRAIYAMLADQGYVVRGAPDGPTALTMIHTDPPELILLDVIMPEMDGFEVCQQLKSEPHTRDIPVMFLSASDELEDKVRGFQLGGVDFINKPFQTEETLARVRTHIDLHRLHEKAQAIAIFAERQRIARELHDSVTQSLYTTSLIAEALPAVWERHPGEARRNLEELRQLTQGALAEMRTLLLELRPDTLVDQPLGKLLHQLVAGIIARSNLPITITITDERELPATAQIAFYRVAQEALNNITKHAQAKHAWVSLRFDPTCITLRIKDDGLGFDLDKNKPHHLGLKIMSERATEIGAELTIKSKPGEGTEILLQWLPESMEYE